MKGPRRFLTTCVALAGKTALAWSDGDLKVDGWLPERTMQFVYDDQGRSPHLSEEEAIYHIMSSLNAWSACGLNLAYVGKVAPGTPPQPGLSVIGWTARQDAAGWARVSVEKGAIRHAAIRLAAEAGKPPSEGMKLYQFAAIAHEIGHALGMRHGSYCDGVMGTCGYAWHILPNSYDIWSCRAHYRRGEQQGFR